jgi:predicted anti-sigma-YlaC factor YlaD
MKCKGYRALMIDQRPEMLSKPQSRLLADHIENCRDCREFQQELKQLQWGLKEIPEPVLPDDCERLSREVCHREIQKVLARKRLKRQARDPGRIPRLVYLALMALMVITLVLIFPGVGELSFEASFSSQEILAFILVLQNAVMLLLSPLLIRRYGRYAGLSRQEARNG